MRPLADIVSELNARASEFEIGSLQENRARIKGLKRSSTRLFHRVTNPRWVFHYGGRKELQFNVGYEVVETRPTLFRHGVAFSFEPSRSMPTIEALSAKVPRFNEYFLAHRDDLVDFEMWHWVDGTRSPNYPASPILDQLVKLNTFVFLGRACHPESINPGLVLADFDRLLPLYLATEGVDVTRANAVVANGRGAISFKAGCPQRVKWTTASKISQTININLRHAAIQQALYDRLVLEFGYETVGTENMCLCGGRVDAVVRFRETFKLYEIKTATSARACIREAIGQLTDYAFWPIESAVEALFVVGEPPLSDDEVSYLHRLNEYLPVPLSYIQVQPTD